MGQHSGSQALGIACFLLVILTIGEYTGYVSSATLGGLTYAAIGFFAVVAFWAALGVYWAEGDGRARRS
jgi:hypothetical protein